MWLEILVAILGVLSISEVLFGGVAESLGKLADAFIERRLSGRALSIDVAPPAEANAWTRLLLYATLGALFGFASLLGWQSRLNDSPLVVRMFIAGFGAIVCGIIIAVTPRLHRTANRRAFRTDRFAAGALFAVCFSMARAIGHAYGPR